MPTPNALSFNQYVTQLGIMSVLQTQTVSGVVQGVDDYFTKLIPEALNYAEQRIARDIDLLPSRCPNTYTLSSGSSILSIPASDFQTILTINGTNGPLLPASMEYLQNVYQTAASAGPPFYYAPIGGDRATGGTTTNNFLIGPQADQNYTLTVYGTIVLPSLYTFATNGPADTSYTFISTYYPDLLLVASCIYISLFQRNFGGAANSPDMGATYESQYKELLSGAIALNARSKFFSQAWSSQPVAPVASPGR